MLAVIQQAVWQERLLHIQYRVWSMPNGQIERDVQPYALVAKAGMWYLVYRFSDQFHVRRVSDLLAVLELEESFARMEGFDLAEFWEEWRGHVSAHRISYQVRVRVSSRLLPVLSYYFGAQADSNIGYLMAQQDCSSTGDEWFDMQLEFASLPEARDAILRCGGGIEVLKPYALRMSVQDYAEQILTVYS